ncbi:unnamed protein product [Citrullus colocynthis]|uniref:Uncharacterized protein n=1 Tax=Citrullus colocynthis TaxID=252529 RepID=A0ABP0XMR4_9ROSI
MSKVACALYNNWWPLLSVVIVTGASELEAFAIPAILKHADMIGWGAVALDFSSLLTFVVAILCYLWMCNDEEYNIL